MEDSTFDKLPGLELGKLDIILKILFLIPTILIAIYVLYVLGKGGHHRINEGDWPASWYITITEAFKSILFILYPLIGIGKILKQRLQDIQNQFKEHINISEDVVNFIASEAKTNIRELIGVLNRVIAFSRLHKRVLNINDCKNILKDVFNQAKIVTVDKIQNTVSNYFNISLNDMLSQRRSRPLARPRQIAMFLAKKLTTRSLPEIGRRFANRDHTTVIHAVKTITKLSEKDEEMKKNLIQIKSLLTENSTDAI